MEMYFYNEKYKKSRIVIICLIVISVIFIFRSSNKDKIIRLVTRNNDFLTQCIKDKEYNKIYKLKAIKDIKTYSLINDGLYIDFYCYGFGLAPSSIYYGFYYVSDNNPLGFQASNVKLEPSGNGWRWQQPDGDNWYYTEKIIDNWYYYEAGF